MMDVVRMPKYARVANLLQQRIAYGDYFLKGFPTDRDLSAEFEVDTRTARRAVATLIEAGLLERQPNGRPAVVSVSGVKHDTLRIAMLSVAYPTPFTARWQDAIDTALESRNSLFRLVTYTHLDDTVVTDTLENFDGIFFGLPGGNPTEHVLRTVRRANKRVVFLDRDMSAEGFPSIWLASPAYTQQLLDHLGHRGHTRVACLNTQTHGSVIEARIGIWQRWTAARNTACRLVDHGRRRFYSPVDEAYRATIATLDDGGFDATALFCTTLAAAKGANRAFYERGIKVGKDIYVCAADDGAGEARFMTPSLTSITDHDPAPYLAKCIDWMEKQSDWTGPLLLQPDVVHLFIGESTAGVDRVSSALCPTKSEALHVPNH